MNKPTGAGAILPLIALFFAGCGTFSARPDPSRFFTLSALAQAEGAIPKESNNAERMLLGIGPIKFPGYLDRQELVVRSAQNRFEVSENDRWAEPLEENFTRVLSRNLSALLRTDRIVSYPWPNDRRPNYQVEVEVLRFEANGASDAQLSARWVIVDGNNKKPVNLTVSHLTRPAKEKSSDGTVAALSEALGDFSREIADAVNAIDGKRK
jgi:uncharacterized lipoprotein YmbA